MVFVLVTAKEIFAVDEKVEEADNNWFLNVVLDTGCPEEANHCLQVFFWDKNLVQLPTIEKVFLEPRILVVEETCHEHRILGHQLHTVELFLAIRVVSVEQVEVVYFRLFQHRVHNVPDTDFLAQLHEQCITNYGVCEVRRRLVSVNRSEANLVSNAINSLDKFSHDLELWLHLFDRGGENLASTVKDLIRDT